MGEEALAVLAPGDAFGEMSLIDDFPRSADARVHERCRLLVLEKDALEDLLFLQKDLGYEILKKENPELVYCAISGFGQDGPLRDLPAYDQIIQGVSGVMSITGAPDTAPYRVGTPICDTIGGLTAAFAIAATLNGREREGGALIDVSMLEATLATMGWVVSNWLTAGVRPQPQGNENVTSAPSWRIGCWNRSAMPVLGRIAASSSRNRVAPPSKSSLR